jgi:hypothetical protein
VVALLVELATFLVRGRLGGGKPRVVCEAFVWAALDTAVLAFAVLKADMAAQDARLYAWLGAFIERYLGLHVLTNLTIVAAQVQLAKRGRQLGAGRPSLSVREASLGRGLFTALLMLAAPMMILTTMVLSAGQDVRNDGPIPSRQSLHQAPGLVPRDDEGGHDAPAPKTWPPYSMRVKVNVPAGRTSPPASRGKPSIRAIGSRGSDSRSRD